MNQLSDSVLSPQDVRKILESDNMEIVGLCKKADVAPKKTDDGKIYFSLDDVRALKQAKETLLPISAKSSSNSQLVVDSLLKSLSSMEESITTSISKVLDERLEGMDEVVVELIRCKTDNETLKQKIVDLNKEIYQLKNELNSYKPVALGLYRKKERNIWE